MNWLIYVGRSNIQVQTFLGKSECLGPIYTERQYQGRVNVMMILTMQFSLKP